MQQMKIFATMLNDFVFIVIIAVYVAFSLLICDETSQREIKKEERDFNKQKGSSPLYRRTFTKHRVIIFEIGYGVS